MIARETEAQAWAQARDLLAGMQPDQIATAQARFARSHPVAQARMVALHNGRLDQLEVAPNLWAGVGLVREGAGTALVGDYDQVAARLREYAEVGIGEFIVSGWPHLEEAHRVGSQVVPRVSASMARQR